MSTSTDTKTRRQPPPGLSLVSRAEHQRLIEDGLEVLHRERVRLLRLMTPFMSARRLRNTIAELAQVEQAAAGLAEKDQRRADLIREAHGLAQSQIADYTPGSGIEIRTREDANPCRS